MVLPVDAEGWLLPGRYGQVRVIRHPRTPKTSPLYAYLQDKPLGIVWHWTAGGYGSGRSQDVLNFMVAESANRGRDASWHFFISKDGAIHQFAPLSVATWTTGTSGTLYDPAATLSSRGVDSVNRATVGVELENAGVLLQGPDGQWYAWPYGIGAEGLSEAQAREKAAQGGITFQSGYRVDASRAQPWRDGNTYDRWPQAQVNAAEALSATVAQWAGWRDPRHLRYGHRTFHPKRDPGLLWMDGVLPGIERQVFGARAGAMGAGASSLLLGVAVGFGAVYLLRRR